MLNTFFATDVRQTLDQFRRSVDEMFDSFYGHGSQSASAENSDHVSTFSPPIESAWSDSALNLRAIVPGVREGDVNVNVQNNQLVIEGERKLPEGFGERAYRQLAYGKFYSAVTLPSGLDAEHIQCRLHDGILDLRIPVAEASKPRKIQIETAPQQKSIAS